jgi:hypothetical protein
MPGLPFSLTRGHVSSEFRGPVASALRFVVLATVISATMYLNRNVVSFLLDLPINNYFAYYQDLVAALVIIIFLVAMFLIPVPASRFLLPTNQAFLLSLVAVVLIGCYVGARALLGNFDLSPDEIMANFDTKILSRGQLFAEVPTEWRKFADALQPTFLFRTAGAELWSSTYLPGNAAIRGLFARLGDAAVASPAMAATSVGLVYGIALKLEPGNRQFAVVAAVLLATSSQFLVTAMTPYAMTAHLALNLAWLWCVLHDRGWSRIAAVAISFLACGLHQAIFHPLFAAPLLAWLWIGGKPRQAALYGACIAAFVLFWLSYFTIALALVSPGAKIAGLLEVPLLDRVGQMIKMAMSGRAMANTLDNLLRLLTWQNPFMWVGFAAATLTAPRLSGIGWALLGGIITITATMLVLMPTQGLGWGYRYIHGALGNLALLGAYGWKWIAASSKQSRSNADGWFAISVAFSVLILLPLRIWQADALIEPFRKANANIAAIPADIVLIDHPTYWFGNTLAQNDPFLSNRPLRMWTGRLSPSDALYLCRNYRVRILTSSDRELAFLRLVDSPDPIADTTTRWDTLRLAGCH